MIVSKISKGTFKWNGFHHVTTVLELLKFMAPSYGITDFVRIMKEAEANALLGIPTNFVHLGLGSQCSKMHILEVIQRFIMILLVIENPKVLTLGFAAKVIHGFLPPGILKSKARRLYDVGLFSVICNLLPMH